jgi:hypothetical protein
MQRGTKPKPPALHVVEGTRNTTRHGSEATVREQLSTSTQVFGPIRKPAHLKDQALYAWKRWIAPAWWLDASRETIAVAMCELWQEFRDNPRKFPASKHGQLRAYLAELGLTDERNRKPKDAKEDDSPFDG